MPFVLPPDLVESGDIALVLAFGKLSTLEAFSVLGEEVKGAEAPVERVSVLHAEGITPDRLSELSGSHKCAPLTEEVGTSASELGRLVEVMDSLIKPKSNVSVSGYGLDEDEYEDLVRSILDGLKARGHRKLRLLRPRGNELLSDDVLSRGAIDIVAFPYHDGFALGPTTWVPRSASFRQRGTGKPAPRPDIALSPRLARALVNIAGLKRGQTLLDPFCGSGTILMEAQAKSLRCLGLDTRASRVQEARENLGWSSRGGRVAGYDVRKGDARDTPRLLRGTKVDAIVTEPLLLPMLEARPKTKTAEAMVGEAAGIYNDALAAMAESIRPDGRIVVVTPVVQTMDGDEVTVSLDARSLGLRYYQPGPSGFEYPVRLSFESTRWIRRAVYVFELR